MAGHVRGTIECLLNANQSNAVDNTSYNTSFAFINLYNFFLNHSNCTIIASNYGNNVSGTHGFAGTGFTYNQSTPTTTTSYNAWFVVRMNATALRPYDTWHLFQWGGNGGGSSTGQWEPTSWTFGESPGSPALICGGNFSSFGGACIAHSCAVGIGGSTGGSTLSNTNGYGSPWNGTTNNNGADTKGSTVWTTPSGGTSFLVYPRSNALPQGSYTADTQNMISLVTISNAANGKMRQQILADDDSWVTLFDSTNTGNYQMASAGVYFAKPGLSASLINYYQFCHGYNTNITTLNYADASTGSCYGTLVGTTDFEGGVGSYSYGSPTVRGIQFDQLQAFGTSTNTFPNLQNDGYYDELDIALGSIDNTTAAAGYVNANPQNGPYFNINGYLGRINFIRQTYNVVANSVEDGYGRYYVGATATQAQQKYSVPWDNVNFTVPLTGTTPQGVTFVSTNP